MRHDYKNVTSTKYRGQPTKKPVRLWHGALVFLAIAVLALVLVETGKSSHAVSNAATSGKSPPQNIDVKPLAIEAAPNHSPALVQKLDTFEIALPKRPAQAMSASLAIDPATPSQLQPEQSDWQSFKVKPGYNLAIICSRAGVKASEVHTLMQLGKPVASLKTLYPNEDIKIKVTPDGHLAGLEYEISKTSRLVIKRTGETENGNSIFSVETLEEPLEARTRHANGVIEDSLFLTARAAGLTDRKAIELANIFAWDIDFALEVRKGDSFTVIYEEYYKNGELIDDGPIIAAEFINQNQPYRAIRYVDPAGDADYFAPDGSRLRKSFLRNPIKPGSFRISSRFDLNRKHPILHKIRAHMGVDYAAGTGTPITATGDGRVVHHGTKGGYGNTIIIQHGQRYSTLYAHMSSYAKNTGIGQRVKQGQIIGYVGHSGLATGPHLHYEFRIDGTHRNPLTVKHPSGEPVPTEFKEDFMQKIQSPLAQLETLGRLQQVALNDHSSDTNL